MNRSTELLRTIFYWLFVLVFVLAAGFYLPHIAGFFALITVALLLPIRRWQRLVEKVIRGNAKIVVTIAMMVFTFGIAPANGHKPVVPSDPLPSIVTTTTTATTTTTITTAITPTETTYVLNISSKKFHLTDCRYANDISEKNKQSFSGTREQLIDEGYTPCGNCQP